MGNLNFTTCDIDLEELDRTEDPAVICGIMETVVMADSDSKVMASRQWAESFLQYAGIIGNIPRYATNTIVGNSLTPMTTQGMGVGRYKRRNIPKLFKAIQSLAANVTKERPGIKVWPVEDTDAAYKKANLGNIVIDYQWDVDDENQFYYEMFLWSLLVPLVVRKTSLDWSFNQERLFPKTTQANDPITGQPIDQPYMNEKGEQVWVQQPWVKVECIPIFRFGYDPFAPSIQKADFMWDISTPRITEIVSEFYRFEPGYFPDRVKQIKKGMWKVTPMMAMEQSFKDLSFGAFKGVRGFNFSNAVKRDGVTKINLFTKPTRNYPKGREIVAVNNFIVYDGDSRVYQANPQSWHRYRPLVYETVPGRPAGTTYAEKLTDLANSYSQTRSEIDHITKTSAAPKLKIPIGAQLERDTLTGEEQVWRFNPFGPGGGEPEYMTPPGLSSSLMDNVKLAATDFEFVSNYTNLRQGMNPQGVNTFRALDILREELNNINSPTIRAFTNMIAVTQQDKLDLMRMCLDRPDQNLVKAIQVFKKMNHSLSDVDIKNFVGESMAGYVKVEPFSTVAKNRMSEQDKLQTIAQTGALGDIVNNPELNSEFKRKMGITGFDTPQNRQIMYARWENEQMKKSDEIGTPVQIPVLPWQDDGAHLEVVDEMLNDPSTLDTPLTYQALIMHREAHINQQAQKMAEQMQMAAMQSNMAAGVQEKPSKKKGVRSAPLGPQANQVASPGPNDVE